MAENGRSGEKELTAAQRRAVLALSTCYTVSEAAKQAQVSERQLRRWRKEPAFRRALAEAMTQAYTDGLRLLLADQKANLAELLSLRSKADDPAIRLRAGLGLEAALTKRKELALLTDLAERIDDLEAAERDDDETHSVVTGAAG